MRAALRWSPLTFAVTVLVWASSGTRVPSASEGLRPPVPAGESRSPRELTEDDPAARSTPGLAVRRPADTPRALARRVSGRVVDAAGKPVPSARIAIAEALRGDPPDLRGREHATTDADGAFEVDPRVVSSAYRVLAVADGIGAAASRSVRPGEAVTLVVAPAPAIEGRVLASGVNPVARARVALLASSPLGVWARETETDERGAWRIAGALAPDFSLRVEAAARGFAPRRVWAWRARRSGSNVHTLDVDLFPVGSIRGVVVDDDDGAPMPGAVVAWEWGEYYESPSGDDDPAYHATPVESVAADATGAFRLDVPMAVYGDADRARVRAAAAGYAPRTVEGRDPTEGDTAWRVVSLRRESDEVAESSGAEPRLVTGRVVLPDGTPAVGAEVIAGREQGGGRGFTDASGRYQVEAAGGTEAFVTARLPGYARSSRRLREDGSVDPVVLLAARTLRGHVRTPHGEPVPFARVSADAEDGELGWTSPSCGVSDGVFELADVPRRQVRLEVWIPRGRKCASPPSAADHAEVDVPAETDVVDVLLGDPAAPPRGPPAPRRALRVTLLAPDGVGRWTGPAKAVLRTLEGDVRREEKAVAGRIEFVFVDPGAHTLEITGLGVALATCEIEVTAGAGWHETSVRVTRGAVFRGTVTAPCPLDPGDVQLRVSADGKSPDVPVRCTGTDLALDGVPAGRWRVVGETRIGEPLVLVSPTTIVAEDGAETTTTWRFVRAGTLVVDATLHQRVFLTDEDGSRGLKTPRTRVAVRSAGGDVVRATRMGGTIRSRDAGEPDADPDAEPWRVLLPPGAYVVRAEPEDGDAVEARAVVTVGGTVRTQVAVR